MRGHRHTHRQYCDLINIFFHFRKEDSLYIIFNVYSCQYLETVLTKIRFILNYKMIFTVN